jgi:hypothetical protein
VGDVQELEAALRMHRRNITAANDAAFRPAFIEQMVYSWVSLTGKSPAHSDERFLAFVISAHATTLKKSSVDLDLPFYVEPWDPAEEKARERRWVDKKDCDPWGFQVRKTLDALGSFEQVLVAKRSTSARRSSVGSRLLTTLSGRPLSGLAADRLPQSERRCAVR